MNVSSVSTLPPAGRPLRVAAPALRDLPRPTAASPAKDGLGFALFLLVNAVLFVRPGELIAELEEWPIYECVILSCLAASFPALLGQLSPRSLARQPITVCVLGLLLAAVLSHLTHFDTWAARHFGKEFAKLVIYYLLLVGLVNSTRRLHVFLSWLVVLTVVLTFLAILQYHGVVSIPTLEVLQQREIDPETGELVLLPRLRSTGIFHDPNDLCLILLVAMAISLYRFFARPGVGAACLWLMPLTLFGYALALTQSRGGFLALLVGSLVLLRGRYGWFKTLLLSGFLVPPLFLLFAGRQTSISATEGTGQERIKLWSEGLMAFREGPIFGVGLGEYGKYAGAVAHNSFVHTYTELGLVGGTLFLAAFLIPLGALHRLGSTPVFPLDIRLRKMRPYVLALVAAYAAGMMSLSRAYIPPTYMVVGLAAAYLNLAAPAGGPCAMPRLSAALALRVAAASAAFFAASYVFVRLFAFYR